MRYGFTTGSCAAAAAKAAAYMLLTGREKHEITITTPKGILYHARMEEISRTEHSVRCAVRKDGGDDPDITTYPGRSRNRKKTAENRRFLLREARVSELSQGRG